MAVALLNADGGPCPPGSASAPCVQSVKKPKYCSAVDDHRSPSVAVGLAACDGSVLSDVAGPAAGYRSAEHQLADHQAPSVDWNRVRSQKHFRRCRPRYRCGGRDGIAADQSLVGPNQPLLMTPVDGDDRQGSSIVAIRSPARVGGEMFRGRPWPRWIRTVHLMPLYRGLQSAVGFAALFAAVCTERCREGAVLFPGRLFQESAGARCWTASSWERS